MADAGKIPLPFQTLLAFGNIFKKSLMLGMAPPKPSAFQEMSNNHPPKMPELGQLVSYQLLLKILIEAFN